VGKENGLQHFPKAFLPPFRHGFHREIVESPTGHRVTHYIYKGERITNEENLGPYIKNLKDITEKNFIFQPTTLPIRDPLNKYQSIRRVKPNQRQGPYRPAFGEIKSDNERLPHKILWQIETAIRRGEHISEEEKRKYPDLWPLQKQHPENKRLKILPEADSKPPSDPVLYKDKPTENTPNGGSHDWP
jgi:hypothetical protein